RGTAMFRAIGWKLPVTFVILATAFPGMVLAGPLAFSAAGTNPAAIQATGDDYRNQLAPLNANVPGSVGNGRRQTTWAGMPEQFAASNAALVKFSVHSGAEGLSCLGGCLSGGEHVGRVRVTSRSTAVGPGHVGDINVVVMDDLR